MSFVKKRFPPRWANLLLTAVLVVLVLLVFWLDQHTPAELPVAVLYALPLFLAGASLPSGYATVVVATLIVAFVSNSFGPVHQSLAYRLVSVGALALAAIWAVRSGADRTRLRQLTMDLEHKAADLESLQAEREMMIAATAHELRGSLSTVSGWSQMLLRQNTDAAEKLGLEAIVKESRRIDQLTQDLMDEANFRTGNLALNRAPCDLNAIVKENVGLCRQFTNTAIRLSLAEQPLIGDWDELRINQVMRNLLSNSLKYSTPDEAVEVRVSAVGDSAQVQVTNYADGVTAESLKQLFRPYQRLKAHNRQAGNGLGLWVSKAILELHGGRIRASLDGPKVCFEFALPLAGS